MESEFHFAECGGWVTAVSPVPGDCLDLLRRQSALPGPVKIGPGPSLRAEMPASQVSAAAVREALRLGLAALRATPLPPAHLPDRAALLERLGAAAGNWTLEGEEFVSRAPSCRVAVACNGAVVLQTVLADLHGISPAPELALAHFALALNTRLHFARASWTEEQLLLEVSLTAESFTPDNIRKALSSIQIGVSAARKECAALLAADVAECYLQFHKER